MAESTPHVSAPEAGAAPSASPLPDYQQQIGQQTTTAGSGGTAEQNPGQSGETGSADPGYKIPPIVPPHLLVRSSGTPIEQTRDEIAGGQGPSADDAVGVRPGGDGNVRPGLVLVDHPTGRPDNGIAPVDDSDFPGLDPRWPTLTPPDHGELDKIVGVGEQDVDGAREQAHRDANAMTDPQADPAQRQQAQQRFQQAATVDQRQQDTLANGGEVGLTAARFTYLQTVLAGLARDKGPVGLERFANSSDPATREAVGKAMGLVTSPKVYADMPSGNVLGDQIHRDLGGSPLPGERVRGGIDKLPQSFQDALGSHYLSTTADPRVGVPLDSVTRLMRMGPDAYQHNNPVNRRLLDLAIRAQQLGYAGPPGRLGEMLAQGSRDPAAVIDVINSKDNGEKAVAALLSPPASLTDGAKAFFTALGARSNEEAAQRAASKVAHYLAEHGDKLNFSQQGGPAARGLAIGLSPYLASLSGAKGQDGVDMIASRSQFKTMLKALMTDPEAGLLVTTAMVAEQRRLAALYGEGNGENAGLGVIAGQMQSVLKDALGEADAQGKITAATQAAHNGAMRDTLMSLSSTLLKAAGPHGAAASTILSVVSQTGKLIAFGDTDKGGAASMIERMESNATPSAIDAAALEGWLRKNPTAPVNDEIRKYLKRDGNRNLIVPRQVDPKEIDSNFEKVLAEHFNRVRGDEAEAFTSIWTRHNTQTGWRPQ